jgi:hypothetical protein
MAGMEARAVSRYLVVYSAVVTLAFVLAVYRGFVSPQRVSEFDRIRVHRIDVVEPDGTERLILSNRAGYPGSYIHGKEIKRPDRNDAAGMLFLDDEGTENGGLIFGGSMKNGKPSSFGHLSFDEYDQDQALVFDTGLEDGKKYARMQLNDLSDKRITEALLEESRTVELMPEGPSKVAAFKAFEAKVPPIVHRLSLARREEGDSAISLSDAGGHERLRLSVAADGTPHLQTLSAAGKVQRDLLVK